MKIALLFNIYALIHISMAVIKIKVNEVFDLMSKTEEFENEAAEWDLPGKLTDYSYTVCNTIPILGGFGVIGRSPFYMKRSYSTPATHDRVWIELEVYMLGTWISTDKVYIKVESELSEVSGGELITIYDNAYQSWGQQTCKHGSTVLAYPVIRIVTSNIFAIHTGTTLNLQIISSISSSAVFFGIREVKITMLTSSDPESRCSSTVGNDLAALECTCPTGEAENPLYPPATTTGPPVLPCLTCDTSCEACSDLSATSCGVCAFGYVYDSGLCVPCAPPCETCSGITNTECLSCITSFSLNPNGICILNSDCTTPYVIKNYDNVDLCDLPCASTLYAYEDGSCLKTCHDPFLAVLVTIPVVTNACNFPCLGQFLDYTGSCTSTCSSAVLTQRIESIYQYCDCYPNYEYEDQLCKADCPAPLKAVQADKRNYCNSPCSADSPYYDPDVGVCLSLCLSPAIVVPKAGYSACALEIDGKDAAQIQKLGKISSIALFTGNMLTLASSLVWPGDPSGISAMTLVKVL